MPSARTQDGKSLSVQGVPPNLRRSQGEQILSLRNQGIVMHEAARMVGITEQRAYAYMKLALDARLVPTVDEFRQQQNDRLDATQRIIENNLEVSDALGRRAVTEENADLMIEAVKLRNLAVASMLRLDERRAKLNGLDAPIRVDAVVTTQDVADSELQQMIRDAKMRVAKVKGIGLDDDGA